MDVYARVHTLETTPEQFAQGLELVRGQLLPWTRESTGFRGALVLVDEGHTETLVLTLWADEAALEASAGPGERLGALAAETTGAWRRSLRSYEVTLLELPPVD